MAGLFDGYNISVSGMKAQRARINIISSNIANANTTRTPEGGPYKRREVVFEELLRGINTPVTYYDNTLDRNDYGGQSNYRGDYLSGVGVATISIDNRPGIRKYDPSHPDANKDGYVEYPNINPVQEMADLVEAQRSYEANLSAFKTQKNIDTNTLDILK